MLPIVARRSVSSPVRVHRSLPLHAVERPPPVQPFMASSLPVSCLNGRLPAPGSLLTTMASADFPRHFLRGISPGKNALLPCTTATFTSTTEPVDFAVLCQLVPSRRPSMWFLFISLQVSSSLPPPGRLPFRSWLQLVISFHVFMFRFFHRGLSPHLQRAHAGRTQDGAGNSHRAGQ